MGFWKSEANLMHLKDVKLLIVVGSVGDAGRQISAAVKVACAIGLPLA